MLRLLIICFVIVGVSACSKYTEFRKHRKDAHREAVELKSLKYPAGVHGIESSDMYKIPEITTHNADVSDLPPDLH